MWWSEHITHTTHADRSLWFFIVPGLLLWLRYGRHNR